MPTRGYRDIAAVLRRAIEQGDYPPGSRIPTEQHLAEQYGVSRETVRRALATLKTAGLLTSATSQGTIVATPPVRLAVTTYAAAANPGRPDAHRGPWETACARQGVEGRTEVVGVTRVQARAELADRFDAAAGLELVHRQRRMWAGDDLAMLQNSWIPAGVADGTPLAGDGKVVGGVYAAMTAAGIELDAATTEAGIRAASGEEQRLMRLPDAAQVLETWRRTVDRQGRVVEVLRQVADGRRVTLVFDRLPLG